MTVLTATQAKWLIDTWYDDPELFVREALGVSFLAKWQIVGLRAIVDHDRIAIKSGHGVGKTTFIAWTILWWMFTRRPNVVPITANRQDQLSDVVWAELKRWHRKLHPSLRVLLEITSDKVFWKDEPEAAFAVARTARREAPEAFQGFHSPNMLFMADEASGIDDIIFETGKGSMSTPGAKTILTGNPTRVSGYFHRVFTDPRIAERWFTMTVSVLDLIEEGCPWVSKDYPEEIAAEYGEESNQYRYRVLGEFAITDDDAVIPRQWIESAINRDVEPTGRTIWGVDVARFGDDVTALVKRKGNVVTEVPVWWRGRDTAQSAGKILNEYHQSPRGSQPDVIMVDSMGVGAGVADILRDAGLPVVDVNVGESPSAEDQFMRLRDELWWKARKFFERRDCAIPEYDGLINELSSVRLDFPGSGKIRVESKIAMKQRGLHSPNIADAFVMTFAGRDARRRTRGRIGILSQYDPHKV